MRGAGIEGHPYFSVVYTCKVMIMIRMIRMNERIDGDDDDD
jgi:hypothetical protein